MIIEENVMLLKSIPKAGRLAVRLAKESYFGLEVMKKNTFSTLPIKEKLFKACQYDNLLEFEPVWQKCAIAIGKACQSLRVEKTLE